MRELKKFLFSFISSMMVMSFILGPIPQIQTSFGVAYADEAKCEDNKNEDGSDKVYKAGCQFNEDLDKSKIKDSYGVHEGDMKQIVEQFVGAAFALVGILAIQKKAPVSEKSCSQPSVAGITLKMVAAGSLAFLIGEIKANAEFREASKTAVNAAFAAKRDESTGDEDQDQKNRDANDKQLEAYATLAEIYQAQINGLDTKVKMATLAELAYVGALGYESYGWMSKKLAGTTAATQRVASNQVTEASFNGMLSAAMTSGASSCASTYGSVGCGCATILPVQYGKYIAQLQKDNANVSIKGAEDGIKKAVEAQKSKAKKVGFFAKTFQTIRNIVMPAPDFSHAKEVAEQKKVATQNDTTSKTAAATRKSLIATMSATANSNACPSAATLVQNINNYERMRAMTIDCTGADTLVGVNSDTPHSVTSAVAGQIDQIEAPESSAPGGGVTYGETQDIYIKKIVQNFYYRMIQLKSEQKQFDTPQDKVKWLANNYQYIENHIENLDFQKAFNELEPEYLELASNSNNIEKIISNFNVSIMNEAHAGDGFKEALKIGVKVIVLYFAIGGMVKNHGFPKPMNRTVLWGIMAAVNAVIIKWDKDALDEAEKRLAVVNAEAERFAKSHAIKTGISSEDDGSEGKLNLKKFLPELKRPVNGTGVIACATVKGGSFAPAVCPSKIPKKKFEFGRTARKIPGLNPLFGSAGTQLGNLVSRAASRPTISGDGLGSGEFEAAERNTAALRKLNDKIISKLDKLNAKVDPKVKGKKSLGLKRVLANFERSLNNRAGNRALSPDLAASLSGRSLSPDDLKKINELKKKSGKKGGSNFDFKVPKAGKAATFDLGTDYDTEDAFSEEATANATETLDDFEIDNNDINENESTNIFKLISNRYLLSYPVLLDEKAENK